MTKFTHCKNSPLFRLPQSEVHPEPLADNDHNSWISGRLLAWKAGAAVLASPPSRSLVTQAAHTQFSSGGSVAAACLRRLAHRLLLAPLDVLAARAPTSSSPECHPALSSHGSDRAPPTPAAAKEGGFWPRFTRKTRLTPSSNGGAAFFPVNCCRSLTLTPPTTV